MSKLIVNVNHQVIIYFSTHFVSRRLHCFAAIQEAMEAQIQAPMFEYQSEIRRCIERSLQSPAAMHFDFSNGGLISMSLVAETVSQIVKQRVIMRR